MEDSFYKIKTINEFKQKVALVNKHSIGEKTPQIYLEVFDKVHDWNLIQTLMAHQIYLGENKMEELICMAQMVQAEHDHQQSLLWDPWKEKRYHEFWGWVELHFHMLLNVKKPDIKFEDLFFEAYISKINAFLLFLYEDGHINKNYSEWVGVQSVSRIFYKEMVNSGVMKFIKYKNAAMAFQQKFTNLNTANFVQKPIVNCFNDELRGDFAEKIKEAKK